MRRWALVFAVFGALSGGCAETVRCDDGEVFDDGGECGPIPDAGVDAGNDAGPEDAGP
ncbi:MAG: hypothetical protein H6719_00990 [Sandaracinaceae bacterium]|nr:hypothetical protein [Sandaracinaceae bacterium]